MAPVTVVSVFQSGITNLNVFMSLRSTRPRSGSVPAQAVALVTTVSRGNGRADPGGLALRPVRPPRHPARAGILAVLLCGAIAALGARSLPLLFVLFFLYGGVALTVYPVAIAYAECRLRAGHRSSLGALLFLYSIGNIATPGLAAGLMDRTAPQAMLFVLGAGGLLVAVAAAANLVLRTPGASIDNSTVSSRAGAGIRGCTGSGAVAGTQRHWLGHRAPLHRGRRWRVACADLDAAPGKADALLQQLRSVRHCPGLRRHGPCQRAGAVGRPPGLWPPGWRRVALSTAIPAQLLQRTGPSRTSRWPTGCARSMSA